MDMVDNLKINDLSSLEFDKIINEIEENLDFN
jgi:hypothetical protein